MNSKQRMESRSSSAENGNNLLGRKIKKVRRNFPMTLEELGAKTSLTKSFLSKIENGKTSPSIPNLVKIAQALETGVSELLDGLEEQDPKGLVLVRAENRIEMSHGMLDVGYSYEPLAQKKSNFEPFVIHFPIGTKPPKPFIHAGHEFDYVLDGAIEFIYDDQSYLLDTGDSIYFDSTLPHYGFARGIQDAKVLAILVAD